MPKEKKLTSKNNEVDLSKVQLVKDYYLDNYNIYVNGYIYKDTKKPAYEAKN